MKFKSVLAALSASGKKQRNSETRLPHASENASPLVPKRLLTPGGSPAVGARPGLTDLTGSGTPRALNYDTQATPQRPRPGSTARSSPQPKPAATRAASVPARTPARMQTRFAQQQEQARGGAASEAAISAANSGSLADAGDNIRVVVRVRPRNEREASLGGGLCVQPLSSSTVRVASHPEPHTFSFDYVAGDETDQETVFKVAGKPILDNVLAGYNGCIFAYGQTGSGKTFTMLGAGEGECDGARDDSRGLIQRVFEHLFGRIAQGQAGGSSKFLLECSFLEIYNETITDLLDPSRTNLQVRENLEGQYVSNLTAHEVYRVEDVIALLRTGQTNRRVAETNMNERSSRSHSVFTCKLQSKTVDEFGTSHIRCSRLHLVDLAGSERQKASGAQGERLKEATAINKSLSALGNVIMSLVDLQHGRLRHIPYRDSRLTYLLQDSLGGNSKTCLVATVSPATVNMAETLSTLRFADQAKRIRNQAVVNEDTEGDKQALKREIKRLNEELAALRRALQTGAAGSVAGGGHAAAGGDTSSSCSTPMRLQAVADGMVLSSSLTCSPSSGPEGARRQALMGALRREDAALKEVKRLDAELEEMRGLLKAKESEMQRAQMMMKLKESRLARLQGSAGGAAADVPAEVAELQQEVALLKAKVDNHPEVKRFAVENLHLSEEVKRYESIVKRNELAALHADVDALRAEMLRLEEDSTRAKKEASAAAAQANAARLEAEAAAESLRAKAVAEAEAKAAAELAELRKQLHDQQRTSWEQDGLLSNTARDNAELQARVELLQDTVNQLESSQSEMKRELDPLRKQVRQYEHDLELLQREAQSAELRASTEQTMRTQAELTSQQLQQRVAALEEECQTLRSSNHQLFRAKSDAEEQRDSAVSSEMELVALKLQQEREQQAASERQAVHAETVTQLNNTRQQLAVVQKEVQAVQREALEAKSELERQKVEHEAAQTAAAARLSAAAEAASELRAELDSMNEQVRQLQHANDTLQAKAEEHAERYAQLQAENEQLANMLTQREGEMLELEQAGGFKEAQLADQRQQMQQLAGQLEEAQAELSARAEALNAAASELQHLHCGLASSNDHLAELQERLAAAEAQQAQAEYELSDKSASLTEAEERIAELKRKLAQAQQQQGSAAQEAAAVSGRVEQTAAQLGESHKRAAELATSLAQVEGQLEGERQQAHEARKQLAQARQQAAELAAQLRQLQKGTLIEKEQQLLLSRAEVQELRRQLSEQQDVAEGLKAQVEARNADVAQLRQEMAAEISEAAQQVQLLLAAQKRIQQLEEQTQNVRRLSEGEPMRVAEAVAAARADARGHIEQLEQHLAESEQEVASLREQMQEMQVAAAEATTITSAQAQEEIRQLIAEREAWIEELQAQRAEATAAVEASRALERRFAEVAEERQHLTAALQEVQERAEKLENELTHLTGQQNINQRIHYHQKIKEENGHLREELGRLRIEQHRTQVRYERVSQELLKLRESNGQGGLPDFDAEDALRDALAATEQQKLQLQEELEELVQSVLQLAQQGSTGCAAADASGSMGASGDADATPAPPASARRGSGAGQGDIVLEFESPEQPGATATGQASASVRRAMADISARQAATARSLQDCQQQIRLLQESSKLQKLRRASVLDKNVRQCNST